MLIFVLRRLFEAIPTILLVITITFFMMRLAPGSPFTNEHNLSPTILANIEAKYHLNDSLWLQYIRYLKQLAQGDFGPSFQYKDYTVNELLAHHLPISAEIGLYAFIIALVLGINLGIVAALKQNSVFDYLVMTLAMIGMIIPSFIKAPLLVLLFATTLRWLPAGGWNDGAFNHLILPVGTLVLVHTSSITRIMRSSMIETLNSPFILTAYAKGIPTSHIILRHALRPAILPVISFLGPTFVSILTGSMIIETIFGLPGIGQLFINGTLNRDYNLILGLTILVSILTILFNTIVDILYMIIDPKINYP